MIIKCSLLFLLEEWMLVELCVDFHLFLMAVCKVELSTACVFLVVVNSLGLVFSCQNLL